MLQNVVCKYRAQKAPFRRTKLKYHILHYRIHVTNQHDTIIIIILSNERLHLLFDSMKLNIPDS